MRFTDTKPERTVRHFASQYRVCARNAGVQYSSLNTFTMINPTHSYTLLAPQKTHLLFSSLTSIAWGAARGPVTHGFALGWAGRSRRAAPKSVRCVDTTLPFWMRTRIVGQLRQSAPSTVLTRAQLEREDASVIQNESFAQLDSQYWVLYIYKNI